MAKLSGGTTLPLYTARIKAYGLFQIVEQRGQLIAKGWPPKRGPKGTPAQLAARAAFTQMVRAVQDMLPEDVIAAREIAKGTAFTWRDVLSSLAHGQFADVPGVQMITTQAALDEIADTPGTILIRGPTAWIGLAPGLDDDQMTIVDGLPAWTVQPTPSTANDWKLDTLDASPTNVFAGPQRFFFGDTVSAAFANTFDVQGIIETVANGVAVGIGVANTALTHGYMVQVQSDGNIVLLRCTAGGFTTLRAAGAGTMSDVIGSYAMRWTISFGGARNQITVNGLTPYMDTGGHDFSAESVRFGLLCGGASVPRKLLHQFFNGFA